MTSSCELISSDQSRYRGLVVNTLDLSPRSTRSRALDTYVTGLDTLRNTMTTVVRKNIARMRYFQRKTTLRKSLIVVSCLI